jgi:DNA-binding MarR family transcriptional regulator
MDPIGRRLMDINSESLGLSLRLVHQHWTESVKRVIEAGGFDLAPSHANILALVPTDGIRVSELTRLAHARKQTVSEVIEELEKRGYVKRRVDRIDRRAKLVFLTRKGETLRPIGIAAGKQVDESWAALTSPEHIAILRNALQDLLTQLQTKHG